MLRSLQIFLMIGFICCLFACTTTRQQAEEETQEKQRKIKTAKINAQLGIAYLEQNNIQRAKKKLMIALDQAPFIPETWYSMAYFYEATGDKQLAKSHYLKAIQVAPKRGDVHNNYGTFLCRGGQYQAAISQFMQAVNDPDYLDIAAAYENAGLCAMRIPNEKQAMRFFNQALSQDPNRPVALYKLADLNYQKGNFKVADIKLQQFLAIAPPNSQTISLGDRIVKKLTEEKPLQQAQLEKAQLEKSKTVADKPKLKIVASQSDGLKTKIVKSLKSSTNVVKTIHGVQKQNNEQLIAGEHKQKPVAKAKTNEVAKNLVVNKKTLSKNTANKTVVPKLVAKQTQSPMKRNKLSSAPQKAIS